MIKRISQDQYEKLLKKGNVRVTKINGDRYYQLINPPKSEMDKFLQEWRNTNPGEELPSFPPEK